MNVLWITNIIFPEPSKVLGIPSPLSGGWMYGMVKQLAALPDIHLAVATTYPRKNLKTYTIDNVLYYLLPAKSNITYQKSLEPYWQIVCKEFIPDIIHVHGTEFAHGLACMHSCPSFKYIISIQGLVGVISNYYYGGISKCDIFKHITFRDILRWDTIYHEKKSFKRRGVFEKEYIRNANIVSGRTSWDYAHVKSINPTVNYYPCNRTLRDSFYTASKWNIKTKTDYIIFLSQADYPIKGLHQVLKAAAQLKAQYPKIKIRIAGTSIIKHTSILDKIKLSGYGSYMRNLVKRLNLNEHIQFLGALTEEQMVAEYKNAHIFICPSSIENSPNSLGEAQIIGVPCIASYVGGIPDMVIHGETGLLYRFEEVEMLAENIRKIFTDNDFALKLSSNGVKAAENRHDRATNLNRTLDIYRSIMSKASYN